MSQAAVSTPWLSGTKGRPEIPSLRSKGQGREKRAEATHIERVFLRSEHSVLVSDPHTQTLLQSTHDLAQLVDRARVHDPRSGADEPHRSDLVPWLGRVRADKRVIHEPKQRGRVRGRLKVAEQELRRACRRCVSRDVRARDGPGEMVKHARGVCAVVVYAREADLECCIPRVEIFRGHLPSILVAITHPCTSPLAHAEGKREIRLTQMAR